MKTKRMKSKSALMFGVIAFFATAGMISTANAADSKRKNPSSKFYVTDVEGEAEINNGEKIESLTKKSVYTAQGSVIETKPDSSNTMVYSNGTGIFFDKGTKLEVRKFVQEPFKPQRTDMDVEPSISQTTTFLARGAVGLCTSKLVAGSNMTYQTPHASVAIRGRKVVIESDDNRTKVSLLEGDVTVRTGGLGSGGQLLRPGQQAIITAARGNTPSSIMIQPIPPSDNKALDDKVTMACMAKNTVYFEVADRKKDNKNSAEASNSETSDNNQESGSVFDQPEKEIVAVPVVPVNLPVEVTVSAARIGNG